MSRCSSSSDACAEARKASGARAPLPFLQPGIERAPDVVPVHRLLNAVGGANERLHEARIALHPVVVEAADVAHPVAVDIGIQPGRDPRHLRASSPFRLCLQPHRGIAALRTKGADGVASHRVVPRPRLEPVVARRNGADRTNVHQVAGEQRLQLLGAVRNQGSYAFGAGSSLLYDPAQRSIKIMPILVIRKGILRSYIHAANLVKMLLACLRDVIRRIRVLFLRVNCFSRQGPAHDFFSLL